VNSTNVTQASDLVHRFLDYMDEEGLPVNWISFDLESPPEVQSELVHQLSHLELWGALKLLRENARSGRLPPALAQLSALVSELHARGVRAHAVTMPMVLEDARAGDTRIQAALEIPFSGVDWDEISVMLYRPEFQRFAHGLGPRIVYDYARTLGRLFPGKASVDLGEVGTAGYPAPSPGYVDPENLHQDVAAALAAGIDRIHVYSLEGMLQQGGTARWLVPARPRCPRPSLRASLIERFLSWGHSLLPLGQR
jgi:hypothetical protein